MCVKRILGFMQNLKFYKSLKKKKSKLIKYLNFKCFDFRSLRTVYYYNL